MTTEKQVKTETIERFWSKIKFGETHECWEWQAGLTQYGYGKFRCRRKDGSHTDTNAQRYIWKVMFDMDLPTEQEVLHKCDNRKCVNPNHLFIGTKLENNIDRDLKGRTAKGSRNGMAKLNDDTVRLIRVKAKTGILHEKLSREFNVNKSVISKIVARTLWKHIA